MSDCKANPHRRRQPPRSHGSSPYARSTDTAKPGVSNPEPLLKMVVSLPGEAVIARNGLANLQVIAGSSKPLTSSFVQLDHLIGRICSVCQLSTPHLTSEKIFAVTKCGHMLCYECAMRRFFTLKKLSAAKGIDCPTCGQPTEQVILTRNEFTSADQVQSFSQSWWTAMESNPPDQQRPPLMNYDNVALFEPTFQDDFAPRLKFLMSIQCYRCHMDVLGFWGPFQPNLKQNLIHFNNMFKHLEQHRNDRRTFCKLCFWHSQTLPIEMTLYNLIGIENVEETYVKHLRDGSTELGGVFIKHPRCTLCFGQLTPGTVPNVDHYFFNQEALLIHANEKHINCSQCPEKYTFFRNVKERDEHFAKEHSTECVL